jgi:hypothetical protein
VGVLVAHHDQRVAVVDALARLGISGPGAPDVSSFHADTGRLTVGLARTPTAVC